MALSTGIDAQVGIVVETTYGTFATPTRFIEFISESFENKIERVESKAIRKGQRVARSDDWAAGTKSIEGDLELEVWNKGFGLVLRSMFGGVATAGTGAPYTHTFTPDDLPSLTVQVGRPDVGGTVRPFTYLGCVVSSWEMEANVGDPVNLKISVVGQDEATDETLATASYPTGWELLTFVGASLTVGGSSVDVSKVSLKGDNGLNTDRYFLGSDLRKLPLEGNMRSYEGEFEAEFSDLTLYNRYVNGTEAALVATFAGTDNPTHKLVVTCNVRFDGDTPTVSGTDIVMQPMSFKCVATGDDETAITAVYTTPDSTP